MKCRLSLYLLSLAFASCMQGGESVDIITLTQPQTYDLSQEVIPAPRTIESQWGSDTEGNKIEINSQYLTMNGKPWIPTFGEFQYSRYPAEHWEDAIIKMKSAGFYALSCYIFWIHHEEIEGEWDWSGRRDFHHFLELCKKHDLKVFARIGPWVNGECRNGGHPDWLVKRLGSGKNPLGNSGKGGVLRSTDPRYMSAVDELFRQLSIQMDGMYIKDGGPIFAIQLDNENRDHGPGRGAELLDAEKVIALKYGMNVPLYTSTGWANAEFTQDNTLPTYGTYIDYFWNQPDYIIRPRGYSFTKVRAEAEVDTELTPEEAKKLFNVDDHSYNLNPYLTCEIGTGMNIAYHRRPLVDADDDAVVSIVELGGGVNAMGYFMFLGGNNPVGKLSYMNRGAVNNSGDNAVISNDFQGAIGEFGQVRDKYHVYPAQLNFMADFGEFLAPCPAYIPAEADQMQGGVLDNSLLLQQAVRSDGERGFIFVNNHIKRDTTYQFNGVQFDIKLKDESLKIPLKPINVAIGDYFIWAFNLDLSGVKLKYATLQPAAHLDRFNTYVLFQNGDIDGEIYLDNSNIESISGRNIKVEKSGDRSLVKIQKAGLDCLVEVMLKGGESVKMLVLTEEQSRQMYKYDDRLYLSDSEALLFSDGELQLISEKLDNKIWCYPDLSAVEGVGVTKDGLFESTKVSFTALDVPFEYEQLQDGKDLEIEHTFTKKFLALPDESYFDKGSIYALTLPKQIPSSLYDVRIEVDYVASALRLYKDGKFVYDNYYNGTPWLFSARHLLRDYTPAMDLKIKILPLQPHDPIYIAGKYLPDQGYTESILNVKSLQIIPIYDKVLKLKSKI